LRFFAGIALVNVDFMRYHHYLKVRPGAREGQMKKTEETNPELREGLTPQERERAGRIGRLEYASTRNPFRYRAHDAMKFIPSREQH
jgi:hypothetical protein